MGGDSRGSIPIMGQSGTSRLPAGALAYLNIRSILGLVGMLVLACAAVGWLLEGRVRVTVLAGAVAIFLVGLAVEPLLNRRTVRWTSYSVEADFIYIARGALLRRSVFLPTRQILNVETVQGPLLQRFGLVKVRFSSITEIESLGPLSPASVLAIRSVIGRSPDHERI